ncbi:MAG: response regulator [Alphaproteobacteria bacterium]|nr:response regulator [Alphaproteobacteria bacterium]
MIERRAIIFPEPEFLNALRDLGQSLGRTLPDLVPSRIEFNPDANPAITLEFTPESPEQGEKTAVTFSRDEITESLLAFCRDQKVPLPENAVQRLARHKDGAALLLESGATGMHVMVVDGQEKMRAIIHKLLAKIAPSRITDAPDGAGAIYMLLSGGVKPDIIICGPQMQADDALDFVRLLRKDPTRYHSHVPVLVLAAGKSEQTCETLRREGASMIVNKPVSAMEFETLVRQLCGHWRAGH